MKTVVDSGGMNEDWWFGLWWLV